LPRKGLSPKGALGAANSITATEHRCSAALSATAVRRAAFAIAALDGGAASAFAASADVTRQTNNSAIRARALQLPTNAHMPTRHGEDKKPHR
jgi:hypothetical protein